MFSGHVGRSIIYHECHPGTMADGLRFPIDGYRIRGAEDGDEAFITDCMRESILISVPDDERKFSDLWMEDILSLTSAVMAGGMMHSETMVLEDAYGERAGMLWMGSSRDQFTCEETGYVLGLFVTEGLRGKGLGKALVECAEDWCVKNGLRSITLNVGSPNAGAKDMYERLGFDERSTVMRKRIR